MFFVFVVLFHCLFSYTGYRTLDSRPILARAEAPELQGNPTEHLTENHYYYYYYYYYVHYHYHYYYYYHYDDDDYCYPRAEKFLA